VSNGKRIQRTTLSIPMPGYALYGTHFRPEAPAPKRPAILFLHGWASSQQGYLPRTEALSALGFVCLAFDLHGHGESGGERGTPAARRDFFNDALAAYDLLVGQDDVDVKRVGVVGASFGGYLGALLTSQMLLVR
jgi:dipeptidyl aminopeptidase/acylaminoacyl peptidase